MGHGTVPERGVKDWLDVVAPVKKGAIREAAGGMLLLSVASIGGSVWMLASQPFWELSRRLPIPAGILGIVIGVWFALLGADLLRRPDRWQTLAAIAGIYSVDVTCSAAAGAGAIRARTALVTA